MTRNQIQTYTSLYLTKAKRTIEHFFRDDLVIVQVAQSTHVNQFLFFGITEVLKVVKQYLVNSQSTIQIWSVCEKTIVKLDEPVIEIRGKYHEVIELEGIINGIVARGCSLATNAWKLVKITRKKIIFMGDRQDYYLNQSLDGAAIVAGGINLVTTEQHRLNVTSACQVVGTIPHSVIAYCRGDIIQAGKLYIKLFPNQKLILLVDYFNDVVVSSLLAANYFKRKLYAIRVDLPPNLLDKSLQQCTDVSICDYGGSVRLINLLRCELDKQGHQNVKIILTSGLNYERILEFEKLKSVVDYYGVGKWLLHVNLNFSANITMINDKYVSKAGKRYKFNKMLVRVL